jgi:hypothetical protein
METKFLPKEKLREVAIVLAGQFNARRCVFLKIAAL